MTYLLLFLGFLLLLLIITAGLLAKRTFFLMTSIPLALLLIGGVVVFRNGEFLQTFESEPMAVATSSYITDENPAPIIKIKDQVLIDAPVINQMPELPRGCEVTSLAMLLKHAGMTVDKMNLAKEVKKDPTPYKVENGTIYFGNPYDGFVGNMYTYNKPGLGVYHKPIKELAEQYLPGKVIDLTGSQFKELKVHLSDNRPVWVIINTAYKRLGDSFFQTWQTPSGEIKITYKEHSVLVTGYDENYIYFNDPLTGEKNRKAPIGNFEDAWVQMGSQAITYLP